MKYGIMLSMILLSVTVYCWYRADQIPEDRVPWSIGNRMLGASGTYDRNNFRRLPWILCGSIPIGMVGMGWIIWWHERRRYEC